MARKRQDIWTNLIDLCLLFFFMGFSCETLVLSEAIDMGRRLDAHLA